MPSFHLRTVVFITAGLFSVIAASEAPAGKREKILVPSSMDGGMQPSYLILPEKYDPKDPAVPLLVSLHSWSADLEQRIEDLEQGAERRGWIYLFPNFRGRNDHPEACGSLLAQQDILDAVNWVLERHNADRRRIYLTGSSGGGHMTMLMAGRHPRVWAAASAWVGISDLAAWHALHAEDRYGEMTRLCCGGPPKSSPKADEEYRRRSPLTHLAGAVDLPLDLAAGIHDGHTGSVPIRHSLNAFNVVARAVKGEPITEEEIGRLSRRDGRLKNPKPGDSAEDASLGRKIHLRREAGRARVTIFEGGHEGIAEAALEFLSRHVRPE